MKTLPAAFPICYLLITSSIGLHAQDLEDSGPFSRFLQNGISRLDVEVDGLTSDDINVWRASSSYQLESGPWTISGTFAHSNHSIDYDPNITTNPNHRVEDTFEGSLSVEREWSESFSSSISGSYYDGFTDFRSIWISEFFRQEFQAFPQYQEADPHGFSISLGNTFSFNKGLDILSVDVGFSRDTIAPGWEIAGARFNQTERTNDQLETLSGSLTLENTLTGSLKSQHSVRLSEVTARQLRAQYQSNFAWAIDEKFTLRTELGGAYERPNFEAYFGGLTLVYQATDEIQLSLGGRLYSDTGEITSANFNSAAPGFDSNEISLSALWSDGLTSVRASIGFYDTQFDPSNAANIDFANLYSDRDFLALRFAISTQF